MEFKILSKILLFFVKRNLLPFNFNLGLWHGFENKNTEEYARECGY